MNTVMRLETKTGELVVHLDIRPDGTSTRTDADDTVEYSKSMTRKAIREMQAILRMGDEYEVITYTCEVAA
jgi:hypothetical protein